MGIGSLMRWYRHGMVQERLLYSKNGEVGIAYLRKVSTLKPAPYAQTLASALQDVRARSITFDNGIENQRYQSLGVPAFFCDPYASWQKGGIERLNGMVRQYFPKGTDFSSVSQKQLALVQDQINRKPRRILGFRSAFEVARTGRIFKNVSV